jgi:hypothetical protein
MVRVAENEFDRFLEKLSFVISSPYRAYLRMRKTGRLSYTKKRTDYYKVINSVGLNIVEEHLIYDYGRSTFEYWLLRK